MTASLQAETTNQVIDQISLTKRTIDQILDRTMELVNQGDSGIAISSLFF